jgi:hypothetical protein
MRKLVVCALLLAVAGCSGKMKMPELDMKMPKMLEHEPPEVKVQREIGVALSSEDDPETFFRQLARLFDITKAVGWDQKRLVEEVLNYAGQIKGQDQEQQYARLLTALNIPRTTVVDAAVARLDSGQTSAAQASRALLRWAAPPDPRARADYSYFRPYLQAHPEPPASLLLWMYDHDPAAALAEMRTIYGTKLDDGERRNIALGEQVVSEVLWRQKAGLLKIGELDNTAKAQLEALSEMPQWWVRLYVAEVLLKNPRLRTQQIVDRLAGERNPLVKSIVERVGAG